MNNEQAQSKLHELHCHLAADGSNPVLRRIVVVRDGHPVREARVGGSQGAKTIKAFCIGLLWAKYRSTDASLGTNWSQLAQGAPRNTWAATLVENLGEDKDPAWWRRVRQELGASNECPFRLTEPHGRFNIAYDPDSKDSVGFWAIGRLRLFLGENDEITGNRLRGLAADLERQDESWEPLLLPLPPSLLSQSMDTPSAYKPLDSPVPSSGLKPGLAPPMPSLMVGRDEALRELKTRLGVTGRKADSSPVQILTAMRGWPGIGKTTLATALANEPEITTAFPDGHLWASLGTKPDLFSELDSWARALGVNDLLQERTLEKANRRMAAVLRNRRLLLIIDDVWEVQHARTLMVGGPGCATLITTRNTSVANAFATPENTYVLERLSDDASLELLGRLAPQAVRDYRKECLGLALELEGLPLALQVAGRMLHAEASRGWNVRELLRELRSGAALLEREAPPDMVDLVNQTTPTIVALLKKSTDLLDDTVRERFALLGVVKEKPATFDLKFMRAQWLTDEPKPTADLLVDRGLLEPVGNQRFTMHALLVALAYSMLEK